MRRMFAEGRTVAEVANVLKVGYPFAYGVRKRWLAAQAEPSSGRFGRQVVPGLVGAAVGKRVLGVDAAAGACFAVVLVEGHFAGTDLQPTLAALLDRHPDAVVVAVDIPIGLPVGRTRPAGDAAKGFVGGDRKRYALHERIDEVAGVAEVDNRVVEVQPEVSFRQMKGSPLRYDNDTRGGIAERRALLTSVGVLLPDN